MNLFLFALATLMFSNGASAQTKIPHSPSECWSRGFTLENPIGGGAEGMLTVTIDPEKLQSNTEMMEVIQELQDVGFNLDAMFGISSAYQLQNGGMLFSNGPAPTNSKKIFRLSIHWQPFPTYQGNPAPFTSEQNQEIDQKLNEVIKKHPAIDPIIDCVYLAGPGVRVGG